MGIIDELYVQATAFWIVVPGTGDFMKGGFQTQVPVQPRTGRPGPGGPSAGYSEIPGPQQGAIYPGNQRSFETVRNAVRFVMEELPAHQRGTAQITTDYGMNYDIKDIESAY